MDSTLHDKQINKRLGIRKKLEATNWNIKSFQSRRMV